MKKAIIPGILIFIVWAVLCSLWFQCKIQNDCPDSINIFKNLNIGGNGVEIGDFGNATTLEGLIGKDNKALSGIANRFNSKGEKLFDGGFGILAEEGSSDLTINKAANDMLDQLATHMKEHPEDNLKLTGFFAKGEKEEIGKARAEQIKKKLANKGIDADRIIVETLQVDNLFDKNNKGIGAVGFEFIKGDISGTHPFNKVLKEFNYEYGKYEFTVGSEFNNYANGLKKYLDENPNENVKITGHTCDISSAGFNYRLGLKRSDTVRDLLVKAGVPASKIKAISKGKSSPAYSNDTEAGQEKNRRVEVEIK